MVGAATSVSLLDKRTFCHALSCSSAQSCTSATLSGRPLEWLLHVMRIYQPARTCRYFHLVQCLASHGARGKVRVRMLSEGPDSVFRPTGEEFEEASSALIPVRTCLVPADGPLPGGFELKTLRSKILRTELL